MDALIVMFLFALGACVGSFLNVVIYRLPRGKSIIFPGSHCPVCGRAIRWYDNIPLVSWIVLRGRCRSCKTGISPRYLIIEAITACLVAGLYVCFYVLKLRDDLGPFESSWPTYAAHAVLLAGLLACAAVDIESWIVPLEVCWFISAVGIVAATAAPPAKPFLPPVSGASGAIAIAASIGLIIAIILQKRGLIQPSFIDAHDRPAVEGKSDAKAGATAVAITKACGVDPRKEILREVLFLGPAIILAFVAFGLVTQVESIGAAWANLTADGFGRHFGAFQAALFGYLVGGAWVWGIRILGTLAFGKEAMGLGDVHILAAVGAVCGWIVPSIAFFVAPVFGLLWALHLLLTRRQRELPYGPWLAVATGMVILFYDAIANVLQPYAETLANLGR